MRIVEWLVAEIYEVVVCPFVLSSPSNFCLLLTRLHWSTCPKVAKRDTWQLICDISSFFDEFVASDLMQTAWWKLQALENVLSWAVTEMAMIVFFVVADFGFCLSFLFPGCFPSWVVPTSWHCCWLYMRYEDSIRPLRGHCGRSFAFRDLWDSEGYWFGLMYVVLTHWYCMILFGGGNILCYDLFSKQNAMSKSCGNFRYIQTTASCRGRWWGYEVTQPYRCSCCFLRDEGNSWSCDVAVAFQAGVSITCWSWVQPMP